VLGDATAICRACGAVHHEACWLANTGCGAYECAQATRINDNGPAAPITITRAELAAAEPLPSRETGDGNGAGSGDPRTSTGRRWNRTAVAAFIVALLGIPLFGLVTGLVAIVIGCVALAGHSHGRRGLALAVIAIVVGLFDVVGWAVGLSLFMGMPHPAVALDTLTLDPESLEELPERIARAMRANVVVQSGAGIRSAIGSGVILRVRDGTAHIVTNRHTVDLKYSGSAVPAPKNLDSLGSLQVITVGQMPVPAKVEWIAPHGVDLAIISAPVLQNDVQEAHWDGDASPHVGDEVFAVGNPHGLGWTHSAGDISQIRRQKQGGYDFRILQTPAAINPGNSGGGLYDAQGRLIGINTMTGDKRFAEGLGFSISLPTLLDLVPERLELPRKNPKKEQ
jgi:S1-C subfamily serine protease